MKKNTFFSHENTRDLIAYTKVLFPAAALIIGGLFSHEFISHSMGSGHGMIVNGFIFLGTFYGIILIIQRMRSAQIDFRAIEQFGNEARKGIPMQEILEQPWIKGLYVRHYLAHIANTGGKLHSQIDQNAIESELHALQAEYNNRLELPNFISGFMIAMGLLGTFIGLLETLTGISSMLDGMGAPGVDVEKQFGELVSKLRQPLAGMGIAFSASMFGLITSLTLAIMMINLRRYINRVISIARNVMHELTVIVSHSAPTQTAAPNVKGDSALASSISNTTIAGRFDLLTRKIEAVLEAIESSIDANQRMIDLMGFGPRMKELSERSLDELKNVSSKISDEQQTLKVLIDVCTEQTKINGALLENQQISRDASLETLNALKGLANSDVFFSQRRDQEFRDKIISEIRSLGNMQAEHKKLSQGLIDVSNANIRNLETLITAQKETKLENSSLMGRLIESTQKLEEVDIGSARHLYDIKERLTKLSNNLNVVDLIASGISGQNVLLETLVEETRLGRNPEDLERTESTPTPSDDDIPQTL